VTSPVSVDDARAFAVIVLIKVMGSYYRLIVKLNKRSHVNLYLTSRVCRMSLE